MSDSILETLVAHIGLILEQDGIIRSFLKPLFYKQHESLKKMTLAMCVKL